MVCGRCSQARSASPCSIRPIARFPMSRWWTREQSNLVRGARRGSCHRGQSHSTFRIALDRASSSKRIWKPAAEWTAFAPRLSPASRMQFGPRTASPNGRCSSSSSPASAKSGLFTDHGPDVAVNANASNPHYDPKQDACSEIHSGDLVLMDMWAKLDQDPNGVYYDITWVGFCGPAVRPRTIENVFGIVRDARDKAVACVMDAVAANGATLRGFEVDDAARSCIREAGYGEYFFHRTGHSIGAEVHGTGANMDNLETHDERKVIPWTCFSIEPGIYLPEFGIRSELNMSSSTATPA